jgi:hypothetical protein
MLCNEQRSSGPTAFHGSGLLVGRDAADRAKNNVVFSEVMVCQGLFPHDGIFLRTSFWFRRRTARLMKIPTLTAEHIYDLHRLYWFDHRPIRKIERHLHMGWNRSRSIWICQRKLQREGPVQQARRV